MSLRTCRGDSILRDIDFILKHNFVHKAKGVNELDEFI